MVNKMRLAVVACALFLSGCATAALPLAGLGSGIRQELQIKSLQDQIDENNQIIEYLLDYHLELQQEPQD